ncbi:hypothetical protein MNBD_GAMMA13-1744 [hydrothermal vent metagenome]|uniref:Uncharacterized protein n=1 Tax=hydrothermal vent metagenome TaxID=652676 RepID=A0A3B0YSG1_9ZZZZ
MIVGSNSFDRACPSIQVVIGRMNSALQMIRPINITLMAYWEVANCFRQNLLISERF